MPALTLSHLRSTSADEICEWAKLGGATAELRRQEQSPGELFTALLQKQLYVEAVHFLAHGLRVADSVRWALLAIVPMEEDKATEEVEEIFAVAARWLEEMEGGSDHPPLEAEDGSVLDPLKALRERAGELATQMEYSTPSSWLAAAISHTEAPEGCPRPELYVGMPAQEVAAGILLSAGSGAETIVEDHDDQFIGYLQDFLAKGVDLARGGKGEVHRDSIRDFFPEDPTDGRIKARVLDLEDLSELSMAAAIANRQSAQEGAQQGAEPAGDPEPPGGGDIEA